MHSSSRASRRRGPLILMDLLCLCEAASIGCSPLLEGCQVLHLYLRFCLREISYSIHDGLEENRILVCEVRGGLIEVRGRH